MPGTSTSTNPRGVQITFTERTHKYESIVNNKKLVYVSGTGFVHSFVPEFDEDGISKRVAEKQGKTQKEILDEWHKKRDESCYFGTKVHEIAEDTLKGMPYRNSPQDLREEIVFNKAKAYAQKFKDSMDILGIEQIVFDERLRLAGTIDLLMRSKKDGSIVIADWKTNSEIKTENKFENCLDPIAHLPNANYYHYCLQLNLYQFLLTYSGYYSKNTQFKRILIHLNEETTKVYQLPDMQTEIRDMLIMWLATRQV